MEYLIDRATEYALSVNAGRIMAGPIVRGACQRHIDDREKEKNDPDYPYYYDECDAAKAILFFEKYLLLNGGQFEGMPFLLAPWQGFIVGSIFGWKRKSDGFRRFRVAYIETAKGSGKSPLAAGIGLKGLVADKEPRAEIYAAATYKDQAMVLFRDAVAFYDQSPELQKRLLASGTGENRWKLACHKTKSFFLVIASDNKKGKSGPRPHMYIADEVHEHSDGTVIGMLEKGFKFRRQPLGVEITNSGHDVTSFCWERHEMGRQVATGMKQNDAVFAYICSLDEEDLKDDAYLYDESKWGKVNPSLDSCGIPGYDYIRKQVLDAKGMPSQLASVKRLNFCVWTEAEDPWISSSVWNACKDSGIDEELFKNRRCWGGLDLSSIHDLTAYKLIFEPIEADPFWRLKCHFWMPNDNIIDKVDIDKVPYNVWRDKGLLFTTPGLTISKSHVIKFINETNALYDIQGIAYDRSRMPDLLEFAEKAGIEIALGKWDKEKREWKYNNSSGIKMMPFGQEAISMAPAIDKFETWLIDKLLRHDGHPVMTWNAANAVVVADEHNYRRVTKRKSIGRVDGVVAAIMACGVTEEAHEKSAYDGLSKEDIMKRMAL
jgi:phage terminase large subunit-like protein